MPPPGGYVKFKIDLEGNENLEALNYSETAIARGRSRQTIGVYKGIESVL